MRADADVVVVGAGIMGLATAHALARAGHDVLVLEQFRLGHRRGSSHGATRVFRLAYSEPHWVRIAQEALAAWRRLEADSGETLLSLAGLLELVRDLDQSSRIALDDCGVAWELLEPEEAERRFPLAVPPGFQAVLQPEAGIVYAERAARVFLGRVRVQEERRVTALDQSEDGVRLETSGGTLLARVAVVTAGAWIRPLLRLAEIEVDVLPTRETVAYFRLATDAPLPAVAELRPEGGHAVYALPDPRIGLKAGLHRSGPPADAREEGEPDADVVRRIAEWVSEHFPLAEPEPAAVETCLYTNTEDERFVLERHGRVVVGSACSGHGFKFAPVVGSRLAALATEALE